MPNSKGTGFTSKIAYSAITDKYAVILHPTSNENVLHPTADNMDCIGFADDEQDTAGLHIAVQMIDGGGERYCVASGSITKGDLLICASGGKVKTRTGSGTEYILAKALEAGTDGNVLRVQLYRAIMVN